MGYDSLRCTICLQVVDHFDGRLDHVYPGPHNHMPRIERNEE